MANGYREPATLNLTVAQAIVKFLQAQYSERDGHLRAWQRRRIGTGD
jgi:TPP-dependent trihydroxycyclohexane-1,2-dione (THcHDO) dehydratase